MTLDRLYARCEDYGDCKLWTQSMQNGSPQATINGRPSTMVRRFIFTELLGKTIPRKHRVIAGCGEARCIAAECITTASFSSILKRSYADGKRLTAGEYRTRVETRITDGTAVLNWEKARAIRASSETAVVLAKQYGCSASAIRQCRRGDTWRENVRGSSVFSWGG